MTRKAIKIDLSSFFDDERKMACVMVNANWKSIACLQKRVKLLFGLESVNFLSDGCFLPPEEPIEIIKFCNEIKAFVPKHTFGKRKNTERSVDIEISSKGSENEESQSTCIEIVNDGSGNSKHKHDIESNHLSNCLPHKPKRLKYNNKNSSLEEVNESSQLIQASEVSKIGKMSKTEKDSAYILTSNCGTLKNDNHPCESNIQNDENISNSKEDNSEYQRKYNGISTPKQKNNLEKNFKNKERIRETTTSSTPYPDSKILGRQKNLFGSCRYRSTKPDSCKTHIYFSEEDDNLISVNQSTLKQKQNKNKESQFIAKFYCPLSDLTNEYKKPRIFHLKSKNVDNMPSKKHVVDIQEHIILPNCKIVQPSNELSLTNDESTTCDVDKHDESDGTDEKNSYKEENLLNNPTVMESTQITKNGEEKRESVTEVSCQESESGKVSSEMRNSDMEMSHADETISGAQKISQIEEMKVDKKTSTMSIDSVDLSIDLDEESKVEENVPEKLDLSANEESNKSSVSDIEEISEIIDLNESDDNCNTTVNNSRQNNSCVKHITVKKCLPYSTDLKDLPEIEDIILFKVPYIDKNKKYVNTNFMAGKIEYINRRTKSIKIFIIDGVSELCHIPDHFVCNMDDSQNSNKIVQLKLTDMREPKLFNGI